MSAPYTTWSHDEFRARLQDAHARYHHLHPFHQQMNAGLLTPAQVRDDRERVLPFGQARKPVSDLTEERIGHAA